jgi:hypothetical protein
MWLRIVTEKTDPNSVNQREMEIADRGNDLGSQFDDGDANLADN